MLNWIFNWIKSRLFPTTMPTPVVIIKKPDPAIPPADHPNQATMKRTYGKTETTSLFTATRHDGQTLNCKVLELAWLNNERNKSCIPEGVYLCEMHPFYDTLMYQLMNVPNRDAIFQHNGNYATGRKIDTEGCQLMGEQFVDLDGNGTLDVTNSVDTVKKIHAFFGNEPYILTIS